MSVPNTEAVRDWANAKFEEKVKGKGLSTNDYTNEDKALVDKIPVEMKATSELSGIKSAELTDSANGHISAISLYGTTHKSKNLIKDLIPSRTLNGITLTNNEDGTYTLNGTATANTYFNSSSFELKDGTYKLIAMNAPIENKVYGYVNAVKLDGSSQYNISVEPTAKTFVADSSKYKSYNAGFAVMSGETVNNLLVKLMLTTDLDATYADYEPYGLIIPSGKVESNAKNLFIPNVGSSTVSGVTFTKNSDGTYTLNGTASADISYIMTGANYSDSTPNIPLKGTYKLIGFRRDIGSASLGVQLYTKINGTWVKAIFDYDDNPTASLDGMYFVRIFVRQGQVLNNVVVKPMITTDLTATYDDYVKGGRSEINTKDIIANFDLVEVNGIRNEIHVFADGTGEKIERTKKVDVGSLNIATSSIVEETNDFYIPMLRSLAPLPNFTGEGDTKVCNSLSNKKNTGTQNEAQTGDVLGFNVWSGNTHWYLYVNKPTYNTKDEVSNFLTDLTIVYELATPTVTPLSKAEVSAFLELMTYSDYTSIESDAEIDIEYYANTEIGQTIADVDSKVDVVSDEVVSLITSEDFKANVTLVENDDYSIVVENAYRVGKVATLRLSITSVTKEIYPDGQAWVRIAVMPFVSKNTTDITVSSKSDGKPIEISSYNDKIDIRGGSVGKKYSVTLTILL